MILKNILTNALKFTEQGSITITAYPCRTGIEFSIVDTGVGIAEEDLPHIFEPFRQGVTPTPFSHGGVGLGLYIVRQLIDLLGGKITVHSAYGEGSAFRVWLPQRNTDSLLPLGSVTNFS
jgi:signal transduction histidine kinase